MEFDRLSIIAPLLVIEMIATDTVICNGRERHKSRERRESKIYTIMEDREVRQKNLIQSLNTGSGAGRVQDVGHPSTERLYTRQLLELEQQRRLINRQTINADISLSGVEDIDPILRMVAQVRASYLKALFDLARKAMVCRHRYKSKRYETCGNHTMSWSTPAMLWKLHWNVVISIWSQWNLINK